MPPTSTQDRAPAAGMSLFERVLVVAVLLGIAAGTAVVVGSCRSVCGGPPSERQARQDIATLESAAAVAIIEQSDTSPCPTVDTLVAGGHISGTQDDPWGHPYVIACDSGFARARSAGADGILGTHDDP